MKTSTIYSKYLLSCSTDWQENNFLVGSILDEEQIQFLNNTQRAIENNNCKAILSLAGCQQINVSQLSNSENFLYNWLFSNISATIHHSGAGITHTSLQYGLTTLIRPILVDQTFNSNRVLINRLGLPSFPIRQTNEKILIKTISDL